LMRWWRSNPRIQVLLQALAVRCLLPRQSTKKQRENKHKKTESKKPSADPGITQSSSGSTRSKLLWSGWKKTLGKVKKIVHDIDEQRIHPHQISSSAINLER
jgi:aspartokinase